MTDYGIAHIDHVASSRLFWWSVSSLTQPWKLLYLDGIHGGDENCNRTIGLRLPGGVLFLCLNIPLRQKPCANCRSLM